MTDIELLNFRDALGGFAPGRELRGVLFLTYNFDGRWFEEVMAPEVFERGVEHCLIIRDGRALIQELPSVRCTRANAGHSTRIFHPKLILAVAEDRALACVGSANLTRGGFERNLELGSVFEANPEGGPTTLFQDLLVYLEGTFRKEVAGQALITLDQITVALREALLHVPEENQPGPHRLLHNYEEPLWDQLLRLLPHRTVKRVLIVSPFFEADASGASLASEDPDEADDGSAFSRLFSDLRFDGRIDQPVTICFQENEGRTLLPLKTLRKFEKAIKLRPRCRVGDDARTLHAKLTVIEGSDASGFEPYLFVLSGSPNFTPAALLRKPPNGNAELAILTSIPGRRRTLDRIAGALNFDKFFVKSALLTDFRSPAKPSLPLGTANQDVADASLSVGDNKMRLTFRKRPAGANRLQLLAHVDGKWIVLAESAVSDGESVELTVGETLFLEERENIRLLRTSQVRIDLYRDGKLLAQYEVPLNVDCPEQFHGLVMSGPLLLTLDARIAQAGMGGTLTYREQAKLLERIRSRTLSEGPRIGVTRHHADLDRFFRHVHSGLRGLRARLLKNARSTFTVRRTLRDLSRWMHDVATDKQLPSDECRFYLIEQLADEISFAFRSAQECDAVRPCLAQCIDEFEMEAALEGTSRWIRDFRGDDTEEFRKTVRRALRTARESFALVDG